LTFSHTCHAAPQHPPSFPTRRSSDLFKPGTTLKLQSGNNLMANITINNRRCSFDYRSKRSLWFPDDLVKHALNSYSIQYRKTTSYSSRGVRHWNYSHF